MKTINLFLASSAELAPERNALSYLAVLLDDVFARRGLRLRIQKWEHMDASLNKERKQTEYNHHIHESELVFVLFWNKFGKYTQEEYDEAVALSQKEPQGIPRISIFFKEDRCEPEEKLINFRREITDSHPEILHSFSNDDELTLLFLLEMNRHFSEMYGVPFLRLEDSYLFADDIRLCTAPAGIDMDILTGKNLVHIMPDYDGLKVISMLLACTQDQLPLRNDFCDLILAWNQILMSRRLRLCVKFFDKKRLKELEDMSELASIIYWKDFGDFDKTAFDYTYQRTIQTDVNPQKFFTFFRREDAQLLATEFFNFKKHLSDDDTYSHFYIEFSNHDELRHKFLLQFELYLSDSLQIPNIELEVQAGYVYAKKSFEPLVNLNELPNLRNSKDYQNLHNDLLCLDNSIARCDAKIKHLKDKTNLDAEDKTKLQELETEQLKLSILHQEKLKQSVEMGTVFLESSLRMAKLMRYIHNQQLKRAASLLDEGMIKECKALLDTMIGDVDSFIQNYHENQQMWQDTARAKVQGLLIKVNADSSDFGMNGKERHDAIRKDYEEALRLAQETSLPDDEIVEQILLPYSHWLGNVNDFVRGIEIAKLTEYICRRLVESHHNTYLPHLAGSLNNQGNFQCAINNFEDAEVSYQKAFEIRSTLAQKNPDVFLIDLAMTLNSIGVLLQRFPKRKEEAEKICSKMINIYNKLSKSKLGYCLPNLALSLNTLGNAQRNNHHCEEAILTFKESVEIYRKLSEENPDVFLSDLAVSLDNLGITFSKMQCHTEAEASIKEALEIREKLVSKNPFAYLPDLASSLNNIGNIQHENKLYQEAEISYEKSINIRRKLAKEQPDVFLPSLASTLYNHGALLSNNFEKAEKSFKEAIDIQRKLAEKQPNVFLEDLAQSLGALRKLQKFYKHYEEAEKTNKELNLIHKRLMEYR